MIDRSEAPAIAAAVACPARRECPAYLAGSRSARATSLFVTRATSIPLNRPGWDLPVPIDRPEQRSRRNARLFRPRLNRANRARLGIRPVGDADLPALGLLIDLGASQRDGQAILAEGAILHIQRNQLRAAERAREPELVALPHLLGSS